MTPAGPAGSDPPQPSDVPLAAAVDGLDCGFVLLDADRRVLHWNRWMAERAGVPAAAATGRRLLDLFPDLVDSRLDHAVAEVLATGMPTVLSHHLNRALFPLSRPGEATGEPLLQSIVLVPVQAAGGTTTCLIQVNDATLAARKERILREARTAKYKAMFDNVGDAILTVDDDGRVVIANDSAAALFGYGRGELVGRPVAAVVPGLDLHAAPTAGYVDVAGRHRNGTELCLEMSAGGWRAYDRRFHTLAIRDVSARRRVEQLLIEAKEQAEQANRQKSTFIANMSHEFRTPLNIIIGFSQLLTDDTADLPDATRAEYLGDIRDSAEKLLCIINDVLEYARIEGGSNALSLEVLDFAQEVEAAAAAARAAAKAAGVAIVVIADRRGDLVLADRHALRRILGNVLSNAVRFSPPGSTVTVRTHTRAGPCTVTVVDTGIGIEPQNLDRVLLPFQQGEAHSARIYGGVGLGLPIAKALVEAHGGRLTLCSKPGIGTEVTLDFPPFERHRQGAAGARPGAFPVPVT